MLTKRDGGIRAWEGPSPVDGTPLVLVITPRSHNQKTGPMVQAWLLVRDQEPFEALRTGADRAICGDCVHRGGEDRRTCYVSMFHGPRMIWRSLRTGGYPLVTGQAAAEAIAGESVRITAYGDPAFVPFEVWRTLLSRASGWAGYTHQWRTCDRRFQTLLMASVETEAEQRDAQRNGWRTFRARPIGAPLLASEFQCPASEEAGHRTTCARCQLCRGAASPARSVTLQLHGRSAAPRVGTDINRYDSVRASIHSTGEARLRLSPEARGRVMLALRQYYLRKKQPLLVRSKRIADGIVRVWVEAMRREERGDDRS